MARPDFPHFDLPPVTDQSHVQSSATRSRVVASQTRRSVMKTRPRDPHLAGYELTLPTILCIESRQSRGGRTSLALGYGAAYKDTLIAALIGEWLSRHFHRGFVECGRESGANLATQAFYDKLDACFGRETPFLAALVSLPLGAAAVSGGGSRHAGVSNACSAERRTNGDVLGRLMRGGGLARWMCCGRVRAHHNPKSRRLPSTRCPEASNLPARTNLPIPARGFSNRRT
jgi:hypothetical protein